MLADLLRQRIEVAHLLFLVLAAREVEELADDGVDLADVLDHRLARAAFGAAHLEREPQARKRRAQIV